MEMTTERTGQWCGVEIAGVSLSTERPDKATTADTAHDPPPKAGTQWGRIAVGVVLVLVIALVILDSFTTKYVLRTAQDFLNWVRFLLFAAATPSL